VRKLKTVKRFKKIEKVAIARQFSLRVVLENIHDPHNVGAILRSCDAVGVSQVDLLYTIESFPKISKVSSASSKKWVEQRRFNKTDECISSLKQEGFKVYGTILSEDAENIFDLDLTEKIAIVMGNEHRGISEEMIAGLDKQIYIPMRGMIQSLNVSVATAVTLYEAQRQRALKGLYAESELLPEELEKMIDEWCDK
jgi:tRNA (guanosine-2'-O-)-methyltransferase